MKPLERDDPNYFTTYCDKSYDRHHYKVVFKNGKTFTVKDYETMRAMWYQWKDNVDNVVVLDKSGNGF